MKLSAGLSCVVLGAVFSTFANAAEVAKVNGKSISDKDLTMALGSLNEGQRQSFLSDPHNRKELLSKVIDREVLAQEGEKRKYNKDQAYKDAVSAYEKQLLMSILIDKEIASKITKKEIKDYYNVHRDEFGTDQVHVQHLVVRDENEAKALLALAKKPNTDFQELAEKKSQDPSAKNNRGDLGFITRDRYSPEFTKAAFALPVGGIAGPVHTAFGYHIIKVIKRKIGKPFELEEVEFQVKAALRDQLAQNYIEDLKSKSKIEINNSNLEKL